MDDLPFYEKHLKILTRRADEVARSASEAIKWKDSLDCLSRSLAYVYTDILKFCDDARRLFPSRSRGIVVYHQMQLNLFAHAK